MSSLGLADIKSRYQLDYVPNEIKKVIKPDMKYVDFLDKLKDIKMPPQYDLETLAPLRQNIYVPYNLYFRRKEIVRTNPHEVLQDMKLAEKIFEDKLKVRKIRPRVYLEPQVLWDEIPEEVMYGKNNKNGLCEYIYGSTWKDYTKFLMDVKWKPKSSKDSSEEECSEKVQKCLLDRSVEKMRYHSESGIPPIDIHLQKYANDWEMMRRKGIVDKSKLFWNKNPRLGLCKTCDPPPETDLIPENTKNEIKKCVEEDTLSTSYTFLNPNYMGYLPRVPYGVKTCKKLFRISDPYVTTLMEAQGVYRKD